MSTADQIYAEFLALKEAGDGRLMLELARRITEDHPRAAEMLNCCGFIAYVTARGDYHTLHTASIVLNRAVSLLGRTDNWYDYCKASINLIAVLNQLGLFHEVADLAERVQEVSRSHPEAARWLPYTWLPLSTSHYFNARYELATSLLNAALRDDIAYDLRAFVLLMLASAYARVLKTESARAAWESTPRIDSLQAWNWHVLALVQASERDFEGSRTSANLSLELWGDRRMTYGRLSHAETYWLVAYLEDRTGGPNSVAYREAAAAVVRPLSLAKIPIFASNRLSDADTY